MNWFIATGPAMKCVEKGSMRLLWNIKENRIKAPLGPRVTVSPFYLNAPLID
jgi:hypothetical protein